jgi:hypothetical protein
MYQTEYPATFNKPVKHIIKLKRTIGFPEWPVTEYHIRVKWGMMSRWTTVGYHTWNNVLVF